MKTTTSESTAPGDRHASSRQVRVVDNPDASRYEAYVGERLAGSLVYRMQPSHIVLVHTEVDEEFEGAGVGSRLAAGALDDARARGLSVSPLCPFVVSYLERHPEYRDLVST